jgi:hypothetical protein
MYVDANEFVSSVDIPKSHSFTSPPNPSNTLEGLMSMDGITRYNRMRLEFCVAREKKTGNHSCKKKKKKLIPR